MRVTVRREMNRMIPRSMPKRAIITEIECANFDKNNGFSKLPMALIMRFDLLS